MSVDLSLLTLLRVKRIEVSSKCVPLMIHFIMFIFVLFSASAIAH